MNSLHRIVVFAGCVTLAAVLSAAESPGPSKEKRAQAKPAAPPAVTATPAAGAPATGAARTGAVLLDNFEAVDWSMGKHDGTEITLDRASGKEGKALKITYDLKDTKQWVQINKPFKVDSIKGKAISFWVKGKGAANVLELKLVDTDGTNYGVKKEGLTNASDWTRVVVGETDMTYFWGGDQDLGLVSELYIAISAGAGGAGETLIDELKLTPAETGLAPGGYVTSGDSADEWTPGQGEGAKATVGLGAGQDGKALALGYSLPENQWVSIRKALNASLPGEGTIVLKMRGEGAANNLEIKLVDRDDSTFGKKFEGVTADGSWREFRVPLSELTYFWGGDDKLDLSLIRYFDLAVSGPGGDGKVFFDEVRIAP